MIVCNHVLVVVTRFWGSRLPIVLSALVTAVGTGPLACTQGVCSPSELTAAKVAMPPERTPSSSSLSASSSADTCECRASARGEG
jgi:hypothetical protein